MELSAKSAELGARIVGADLCVCPPHEKSKDLPQIVEQGVRWKELKAKSEEPALPAIEVQRISFPLDRNRVTIN